jgi:hypothetical protein
MSRIFSSSGSRLISSIVIPYGYHFVLELAIDFLSNAPPQRPRAAGPPVHQQCNRGVRCRRLDTPIQALLVF